MNKYSMVIKVYEAGSISKAAAQTSYSQSAVSQVISSVENELGFPLFKRLRTGMMLTDEGKKVLPAFQNIVREEKHIRQVAQSMAVSCEGMLTVGSIPGADRLWLPDIIEKFSEVYPRVTYKLIHASTENIQKGLCGGMLDCGFTTLHPVNRELDFIPLQEDGFLILLPEKHPLTQKEKLGFEDIMHSPLLIIDSSLDSGIMDIFSERRVTPNIYVQGRDVIGMIRMIGNGLGLGVFSRLSLAGICVPEHIVCKNFEERYDRVIGISVRKNQKQSLLPERFMEFAYQHVRGRN